MWMLKRVEGVKALLKMKYDKMLGVGGIAAYTYPQPARVQM